MSKEETLARLSIRLSHLAQSDDETLNGLLGNLRLLLGEDSGTAALEQVSGTLAKHVLLQQEQNDKKESSLSTERFGKELATAISRLRFDSSSNKKLKEIAGRAKDSNDLSVQLTSINEVFSVAQSAASQHDNRLPLRRTGWFGGKSQSQLQTFVGHATQLLEDAVDHIDVLNGDNSETKTLRRQLENDQDSDALCDIVNEVIELLRRHSQRIDEERANTLHFLGTLRERLLTVEESLYTLRGREEKADTRVSELSNVFSKEMTSLSNAATSNDIGKMQHAMTQSVEVLTSSFTRYMAEEKQSRAEGSQRMGDLNRRIHQIEGEARDLRGEIKKKQDLAVKDPLTAVYNRAGYDERIGEEFERMRRIKGPLSLVFIDCNKFKSVNDTFGHAAGDIVLVQIAKALVARARVTDVVTRYGGDEFVVILPDTLAEGAKSFSGDVCRLIEEAGFNNNGQPLSISVSCGIAQAQENDTPESLLERADNAMYLAKSMPNTPRIVVSSGDSDHVGDDSTSSRQRLQG